MLTEEEKNMTRDEKGALMIKFNDEGCAIQNRYHLMFVLFIAAYIIFDAPFLYNALAVIFHLPWVPFPGLIALLLELAPILFGVIYIFILYPRWKKRRKLCEQKWQELNESLRQEHAQA